MNNKIIIAIVCALIVVCLAVGIGMNGKSGNSEKETNLISNKETVSAVDESSALRENSETKRETESTKTEQESQTSVKAETNSVKTEKEPQAPEKNEAKPTVKSTKKQTTTSGTTKKQTTTEKTTKNQNISVSFSVNCEKAVAYGADYPKYLIGKTKCNVKKGTTVFDLLSEECGKNGIAVVHQNKSYVQAIGGLSEKDCGNASGWTYKVNGVKPMMAASKYVLKDGDVVEWYYVTSPTD
ncbi:MAG: DUF4430 domain-containing protein [Eubacterium sp.]|nr:DUF4430 domain-containing protein [Eubacterium sp.]